MTRSSETPVQSELTTLLSRLVSKTGARQRLLAQRTGLTKDQISRTLCGTRRTELDEMLAILSALDLPARATVALALFGRSDLAISWSQSGASGFLEALIEALPECLDDELGSSVDRINPRWGRHSARVVAQRLATHLRDIDSCEATFAGGLPTGDRGAGGGALQGA
jgi:transcriptional regulator with XRE-family HTH domain